MTHFLRSKLYSEQLPAKKRNFWPLEYFIYHVKIWLFEYNEEVVSE